MHGSDEMNRVVASSNRLFDRIVRPEIRIMGRALSAYRFCGYVGLVSGTMLMLGLASVQGLDAWIILFLVLAAVLTFLAQAMATKIITGDEDLVYYRHEIAVLAVTALLLWVLRQPILPYLETTLLGVGLFLACGRIGCLLVGCCYGRPSIWGASYRPEHAAAGFPDYYVGIRLWPSQAIESLWVFAIVGIGAWMVLDRQPAGAALGWYIVAYDVGRFFFEFRRGDPDRPYWAGYSEAQWISLLLTAVVVAGEWGGWLPFVPWHFLALAAILATIVVATIVVVAARRLGRGIESDVLHPRHVQQFAAALAQVTARAGARGAAAPNTIPLAETALGIRVSAGELRAGSVRIFSISRANGALDETTARRLADLILRLRRLAGPGQIIRGTGNTYHLLVRENIDSGSGQFIS